MNNEVIRESSKDGVREVVITRIATDSCKIELLSKGFCQVELTTHEDLFALNDKQLDRRPCFKFMNDFLKNGIENMSFNDVSMELSANRRYMKCDLLMKCTNSCIIVGRGSYNRGTISINIFSGRTTNSSCHYDDIPYNELASMSVEDIFYKASGWNLRNIEVEAYSYKGAFDNYFSLVKVDGISLYMRREDIAIFSNCEYLKKVDFLNSHNVLNLNDLSSDIVKKLTKANLLGKQIVFTYMHDDCTPEFLFL